ncbi:MAG: hypothetical protein ACREBD_04115 [Blastocatellia bacterium]
MTYPITFLQTANSHLCNLIDQITNLLVKEEKYMNASEFAALRGFPYTSVLRWLRKDLIPGVKKVDAGNITVYLIPEGAVKTFQRPKIGRPKKSKKTMK